MSESVAVLASGHGSNFAALIHDPALRALNVKWSLISDQPKAQVIARAAANGVQSHVVDPKAFISRDAWAEALNHTLSLLNPTWIVLAGFMRILPSTITRRFDGHIINLHPSLLPDFPGLNAIERAWQAARDAGLLKSGCTVHFVDEGLDTGPIIAQAEVPMRAHESLQDFERRIHEAEHKLLPFVLRALCTGRWDSRRPAMVFADIESLPVSL